MALRITKGSRESNGNGIWLRPGRRRFEEQGFFEWQGKVRYGDAMKFILNALDRRRVWKEMSSYPVYSPPFHDAENVLAKHEIKANFDYFLEQKARRLECLARFLDSFSVVLWADRDSMKVLDGWIFRYGGHLLPKNRRLKAEFVVQALLDYEPAWVDAFHGLNVMNDIGVFVGDYIVSRNPDIRWDVNYGDGTKHGCEKIGFGKPCLFGLAHLRSNEGYPILGTAEIYDYCNAGWSRLRGESEIFWPQGELVRRLDYLTQSRASRKDTE